MNTPEPHQLFGVLDATWPPARFVAQGPWTLREGKGGGQRVSAATANSPVTETDIDSAEAAGRGHGRDEWRRAEVIAADPLMPGHRAFIRITAKRGSAKPVTRLYMASAAMPPHDALGVVRAHWMVENGLHWMLDVHFGEDMSRARKDNAPANVALLTRLARNILQIADKPSVPISHRIKKCNWNDDYLVTTLAHMR